MKKKIIFTLINILLLIVTIMHFDMNGHNIILLVIGLLIGFNIGMNLFRS